MTNPEPAPPRQTILGLGSYRESQRIGAILRKETVGGLVLIVAAAVAMTVIVLIRRPRLPRTPRSILVAAGWGLAWFAAYSLALSAAEVVLDPATAAMVVNIAPLIVALVAGLAFGEGLPARLLIGIGVAFAGVVLIAVAGFTGKFSVVGLVLALAAAAIYAACVLVQKRLLQGEDPVGVTWIGIIAGLVAATPWPPVSWTPT